jgi:ribonuclease BN (tRNA processing enzyme)
MELEILGAHNCESRDAKLTSLLIDRSVAIDAGSLTSSLSIKAQRRVKAILITHHHFDHIRDLATLGMNAYMWRTIDVYALDSVLGVISSHLLNEVLYPDFRDKPSPEKPALKFCPLEPSKEVIIEGYTVLPLPVNHSVPTIGYQVTAPDKKSFFYTGDTGRNPSSLWEAISPGLLVTEVTLSDKFESFAQDTGHLTPRLLKQELLDFKRVRGFLPPIVTVHMSPHIEAEIKEEVALVAKELAAKITPGYEGMKVII